MLISDHYTILSQEGTAADGLVRVQLNPECPVYQGHFPEMPVSPGVCNIQMVLECANLLAGRALHITYLQQSRMTRLITPDGQTLDVHVALADGKLLGSVGVADETFLTIKAEVE